MKDEFIKLEVKTKEFSDAMSNLLSVWDNHCIYICHPNHVINLNKDWDDINIKKMFKINDYKTFISFDYREAFAYVHKRLGSDVMAQARSKGKDKAVSYLAVVEKYLFEGEDNYLVRGIIKGDINGYSVMFNPEFAKTIPNNIFEKVLRLSDDDSVIPETYKKRRK